MPNRAGNLFPQGQRPFDARNREGAPAYRRPLREECVEVLTMGTFGGSFYAKPQEMADEAIDVMRRMAAEDIQFLAQAAVWARNEGLVRLAPIVALAVIAQKEPGEKRYFRAAFDRIIRTGDDLRSFVTIAKSGRFRQGFGGCTRRAVASWLNVHLDEYQAIKYAGTGDQFSLRNILRMAHPTPPDRDRDAVYSWVVCGWDASLFNQQERLSQIALLERAKRGEIPAAEAIRDGNIGAIEAIVASASQGSRLQMDRAAWRELALHAPYMMLLRSLATFQRHGVFGDGAFDNSADIEVIDHVVDVLKDPERVRKSRQFPWRFYSAIHALPRGPAVPVRILQALEVALDLSAGNLPNLGEIAVAPDISGSMRGTQITPTVTGAALAGLFTAAICRASAGSIALPWNTQVVGGQEGTFFAEGSLAMHARNIELMARGGTDMAAPVRALRQTRRRVSAIILLTDAQEWYGWKQGTGMFIDEFRAYKREIAPDCRAVVVQLVPANTTTIPPQEPGVTYVYGWSPRVPQLATLAARGIDLQLQEIAHIDLGHAPVAEQATDDEEVEI